MKCPKCGHELEWFSGLEGWPEFYFCPICNNWAYNENLEKIFRLE